MEVRAVLLAMVVVGAALPLLAAERLRHQRPSMLSLCNKVLANMTEHQVYSLRDVIQVLGQHRRREMNWRLFREKAETPPSKAQFPDDRLLASVKYAYQTNRTLAELKELEKKEMDGCNALEDKIRHMLGQLKQSGALAPDANEQHVRSCAYGRANPHLYEYRPKVTFMLQYFKRPHIIQTFIQKMQEACAGVLPIELVVNVDHPADHEAWANASYSTNGFVVPVFSNNLHEVRAYNRMAHLARGEYLVMMQDDDLMPKDCAWLPKMVSIFDRYPHVGVVGLRNYVRCLTHQNNRGSWYKDPQLGINMQFVQRVDMAPMAIRKAALMHVGGMDETLTEPGECGIITDWELCHRMWVAGWQVVAADQVHMDHDTKETGGTHTPLNEHRCWGKQQTIVGHAMGGHGSVDVEKEMCEAARRANIQHLTLIDPAKCPYEQEGCT